MEGRILTADIIDNFRKNLELQEKSMATIEKYKRFRFMHKTRSLQKKLLSPTKIVCRKTMLLSFIFKIFKTTAF